MGCCVGNDRHESVKLEEARPPDTPELKSNTVSEPPPEITVSTSPPPEPMRETTSTEDNPKNRRLKGAARKIQKMKQVASALESHADPSNPSRLSIRKVTSPSGQMQELPTSAENMCYMLSIIQSISACLMLTARKFEIDQILLLFSEIKDSDTLEEAFHKFFRFYSQAEGDFNQMGEMDEQKSFGKMMNIIGSSQSSNFTTEKTNSATCMEKKHLTFTQESMNRFVYKTLKNFEEKYKQAFSDIPTEKMIFCAKCQERKKCNSVDEYKFGRFLVFYFNEDNVSIRIRDLEQRLLGLGLTLIAVIQKDYDESGTVQYQAYVSVNQIWYLCRESSRSQIGEDCEVTPYVIFTAHE